MGAHCTHGSNTGASSRFRSIDWRLPQPISSALCGAPARWSLWSVRGHGDEQDQLLPKKIEAFAGQRVVAVSAGGDHSLALTADGAVWSWGNGDFDKLGHGPQDGSQLDDGLGKRDKSFAGRIDPKAVDVCGIINDREEMYTTSSCAGRCFMYKGPGIKSSHDFKRFRISHSKIADANRFFDLSTIAQDPSGGGDPIRSVGQYDYKTNDTDDSTPNDEAKTQGCQKHSPSRIPRSNFTRDIGSAITWQ